MGNRGATYDVAVIGAGIVGAAIARTLSRDGVRVVVLERSAAASGTSGQGEGNLLVSDKAPGRELELALHANRRWAELADELADELGPDFPDIEFERKGGLVVATTEAGAEPLKNFARSQATAGVDAQIIAPSEALQLEPDLNPAITAAVAYPQDAQVQPVIATEALLASARRAGAEVRCGVDVLGSIRSASGELTGVQTTAGAVTASTIINAAGPWAGDVASRLGVTLPVRPRRGVVLVTTRMPHRIFRKVYDGDYFGATQSNDAALQTSSVIESTAAGTVLIGSSREQIGFDSRLRAEVIREIAAKSTCVFPFLRDASVMRAYGGFRPFMPDHLPVIGPDHRVAGLWHATGHEGAGIGLSVSTADLVSDLFAGRAPELNAAAFSVARPTLAAALAAEEGAA
ncbi:NAD(P)/FAD-dependent oxidoreductase [Paramicrobacterium agarici]|uniref:Glycine/D-amino acid oxidase-like deaminating enzyme n=1 Tax=Paramicrobacterium agarici TaxID=630514 RepID=A0A2A9DVT0_9MICO|nr:FAD-dependent oxidoreductase [Microbacterium agarici]PFG30019.1 glycine/D-amino acid oxidase-like deaminating enzyme [Microbacterium agarici]